MTDETVKPQSSDDAKFEDAKQEVYTAPKRPENLGDELDMLGETFPHIAAMLRDASRWFKAR